MANGWTLERRAGQAKAIRRWKPWVRSTGPRTVECKSSARINGDSLPLTKLLQFDTIRKKPPERDVIRRYLGRLLCVSAFLGIGAAYAGPFGLEKGMTVSDLERAVGRLERTSSAGVYKSAKVPKPHREFEYYLFVVTPATGLCKIHAVGKDVEEDAYGFELRRRFASLSGQLTAIYGSPRTRDFLRSGSIWKEENEWMMGLSKNERVLMAHWPKESDATLKDAIEAIELQASALNSSDGYLALIYQFDNFDACSSARSQSDREAL